MENNKTINTPHPPLSPWERAPVWRKLFFIFCSVSILFSGSINAKKNSEEQASWANWEKKLDRAFADLEPKKIPGRSMGILVPSDPRPDLLPLTALAYSTIQNSNPGTLVVLMPGSASNPVSGLVSTDLQIIETSFGVFSVDTALLSEFKTLQLPLTIDNSLFYPTVSPLLENQLACLKYIYRGKLTRLRVLPIYVNLTDPANEIKDIGPALADKLKDLGLSQDIIIVIAGNLTETGTETKLISTDSQWLTELRSLDVDGILDIGIKAKEEATYVAPQLATISLGTLMLKWLNGDHMEILAYAHSGQLVLTKDKSTFLSYVSAAVASGPPYPNRIPHIDREKLLNIFDELFRSDLLTLTRQTCASILDLTAAKPPSLTNPEAERKWPVYVTLYDPDGKLAGQAGSYAAVGPLEESIRNFAFEAVQQAKPKLTKENFSKYVVDVSIPHGFSTVSQPEDLIPQLNGIVVEIQHKKYGFHTDAWRTYPDPHQLLSAICVKLGLNPWDYATDRATIESFRLISFNEKEPFQDLNAQTRRKKKKAKPEEGEGDAGGAGGDTGGAGAFPF